MNLVRISLATATSALLLATVAACGGSSSDGSDAGDQAAAQSGALPEGGGMTGGGFPGATGLVAAVSGRTAQVQNAQSGQVAVSWTAQTTFSQQVDASLRDVTVGTCVLVTSTDDGADATAPATQVTAATVRVVAPSDEGDCGFGGAGGGMPGRGQMPSGAPSEMPSDIPSDMPSDMPRGGGSGTVGEVVAVSDQGFTVSSSVPSMGQGSDSSGTPSDPVEVVVDVTGDTTYTAMADATASAVRTGVCLSAQGDTDDTGALTASSISITEAVDGACTGGFGGGMPGATS